MSARESVRIETASPPDREKLVAQIMIGSEQWAEINQEKQTIELEIYPRQDGSPWILDLEEALAALAEARRRLLGLSS